MQVTEITVDGLKHEFKIVVPAQRIETHVESRLKELSRQVRISGFRPGKVPMSMMKTRYGSSVMGEVLETSVQEALEAVLAERSLTAALQPKVSVDSFDQGKDLEFSLAVEVLPEIEALDMASISLSRHKINIEDREVDEFMARLAEDNKVKTVLETPRESKKGDIVEIDFVGTIDGVEFPGGTKESHDLELGSNTFIPGFEDQIIGAKPGDALTVSVAFPQDYHAEALAGKEVEFAVTVKALKETTVPALDDAFATSVGFDDLNGLRTSIAGDIETAYANAARQKMKGDLLDILDKKVTFDLPAGLVSSEFDAIWTQMKEAQKNDALDQEDKGKSDDELREEYTKIAERRVRLALLLGDVGRKNSITVTQEDFMRAVARKAEQFPGQERFVFEHFRNDKDAVASLRGQVYEDKVIDFICEMADITDLEISSAEWKKSIVGETVDAK